MPWLTVVDFLAIFSCDVFIRSLLLSYVIRLPVNDILPKKRLQKTEVLFRFEASIFFNVIRFDWHFVDVFVSIFNWNNTEPFYNRADDYAMHRHYNLDDTSHAHDGSAHVPWLMDHRAIIRRFACKFMPMQRHYTIRNSPYANRENVLKKKGKVWIGKRAKSIQRRSRTKNANSRVPIANIFGLGVRSTLRGRSSGEN